jgi:DNA adenine methylase
MSILKAEFVDLRDVHPFVKWAGGKGQLLSELNKMIPRQFNTYFEPFLGGAAMFLHLASKNMIAIAYLSDTNEELIKAFKVVRDRVRELIKVLNQHQKEYDKNPSEYYYRLRDEIQPRNDVEIAARFITLNKTCFNGLYRVNQNGKFNVPMGEYKKPLICDGSNLKNVSSVLRHSNAEIQCVDYREMSLTPETNDFVYLDPPYDPVSYTSDFTAYTPNGFGRENQEQLANLYRKLSDRGCFVLLSNSNTPFIRELYSHFRIKEVDVQRAINCKGSKRADHKELLISNYSV